MEGYLLKRIELVETLPIIERIHYLKEITATQGKSIIASLLNGFFEDLESAVYTKVSLSKN
ncbi:hypothetical protein CO037_01420 [Candidatus Pacearchaeota archaeon CG_4_9_14_0_2_um_filter_30_8]|nr:MAG: hypothetical protein CO037_01420 [Candidatus Pacearchaeota archaeon CG_4_9_14_0_2_um_filter_30_8]